ncbi:unnamed protein product [Brassica napus]|uniref:(rape) hypothetical protein n=1 Tax=Brassica napus TaxID=3708 RepID=A0A816R6T6_BRANA|nr:unnamed protein product [Brassica napus]
MSRPQVLSASAAGRGVRTLRQRNEQELTPNVDAAAAAGTCGNQTNSPLAYSIANEVQSYLLNRCSLFRLFHKSGPREQLDERRRLSMAYDVAKGMNYLHNHNPLIVHRDLKSPNLLVDKKYTVKVCDLGLSVKGQDVSFIKVGGWKCKSQPCTVLGSSCGSLLHCRNHGGTLNLAQVVASGGFKNKRLEIPWNLNPQVAAIIEGCWTNEPWNNPSFATIMDLLRPLVKLAVTPPNRLDL